MMLLSWFNRFEKKIEIGDLGNSGNIFVFTCTPEIPNNHFTILAIILNIWCNKYLLDLNWVSEKTVLRKQGHSTLSNHQMQKFIKTQKTPSKYFFRYSTTLVNYIHYLTTHYAKKLIYRMGWRVKFNFSIRFESYSVLILRFKYESAQILILQIDSEIFFINTDMLCKYTYHCLN